MGSKDHKLRVVQEQDVPDNELYCLLSFSQNITMTSRQANAPVRMMGFLRESTPVHDDVLDQLQVVIVSSRPLFLAGHADSNHQELADPILIPFMMSPANDWTTFFPCSHVEKYWGSN